MKLDHLLQTMTYRCDSNIETLDITGIAYDSRQVKPGYLFVAIAGFVTDGHRYISQAKEKGAVAFIVNHIQENTDAVQIYVKDTRKALAEVSYLFYGTPSLPSRLIGITGTNGKTTITHLLYALSENQDEKPGLIGTLGTKTPDYFHEGHRTTPESTDLAEIFYHMADENVNNIFMEVSSHAIALKRVETLEFRVALFTNLTQDHLDFHENMENYFETKSKLFNHLSKDGCSVINIDDHFGRRLYDTLDGKKISYSMRNPKADVYFDHFSHRVEYGIQGELITPYGKIEIDVPLIGLFNAENIAGVISVWIALHPGKNPIFPKNLFKPVPGRMEMIPTPKGTVIIDYAHTPDAIEKALNASNRLEGGKRIITVFGCGGNRDKDKRALMGAIAEKYSHIIILTNDNPRDEDPKSIMGDIMLGIKDRGMCMLIEDRSEALENAYYISEPGDVVMIMGKGAEDFIEIKGKHIHFSDKEKIEEILKANS